MIETLVLAGLLGYASLVEPALLFHRRFSIRLRGLPEGWDGARIHLVTDLHCNRWTSMESRIARILAEPADLLLFGGDIVNTNAAVGNVARLVQAANVTRGAFGVLGNAEHKRWVDTARAVPELEAAGVRMLGNEWLQLMRSGDALFLVGVDDPHTRRADLSAALRDCPSGFRLLLAHAPQVLRDPEVAEVDLVLCGHTHGGQVRVPGVGGLLAHSLFEWQWSEGHFYPDQVRRAMGYSRAPHVYVSRGVGTGFIHFRFLCPPEVQTITLRRA